MKFYVWIQHFCRYTSLLVQYWLFGKAKLQIKVSELMQAISCEDQRIRDASASALVEINSKINDAKVREFLREKGFVKVLEINTSNHRSLTIKDIRENRQRFEQTMTAREKLYYLSIGLHVADLIGNLWNICAPVTIIRSLRILFDMWENPFSLSHFQECQEFTNMLKEKQESLQDKDLDCFINNRDKGIKDVLATLFRLMELHALKKLNFRDARTILMLAVKLDTSEAFYEDDESLYEITSAEFSKHLIENVNVKSTRDVFEIIAFIQNRCQFYNYEIYQQARKQSLKDHSSVEDYDEILRIVQAAGREIERKPLSFGGMAEEALRDVFLVALSTRYPGQTTGETFNKKGKTDILIRVENKNIFIGECKFWGGKKKLKEILDQLLGYATWRDDQLALLFFSQNKNFSAVLEQISEGIREHPNFICEEVHSEDYFFCLISHPDDSSRQLKLAVLAFDIPP